ncbi:sensor histidine kinase [Verrucomicrobium spinosum]|uniref:sensor histidine kinase n=1 Tax=Verrucomicrobium spinosum TaxID=2736 RepID=UPI000174488B|nr:sensor histidine kinase [Verrucomicrobium spinosum]
MAPILWGYLVSPLALPAVHAEYLPNPAPVVLLVDGKPFSAGPTGFRVPAFAKTVSFRLGKSAQEDPENCRRIRFKLDGVDESWRQIESEMCLIVRFADAAGDQVGQRLFPVDGISAGWRGETGTSTFTLRRESLRVPPDAATVTVAISSSGPPTAMGLYAVRDLKLSSPAKPTARLVYETASGLDEQHSLATGWTRSGTRPSMARLVTTPAGEALCILDDDAGAHAEWNLLRTGAPRVTPGETLTVEWSEMYNIGMGNRFDVNYGRLNASTYTFWSDELDATGNSLQGPRQLQFVVLKPLWRSVWFWISSSITGGLVLWWACRAVIRRRIRQHLARAEQERLVELERLRIARDLHDDLGARLTHISLMSGLAENEPQSESSRESFQRISAMARELVGALYQTVWTVNPEHDHLEALVNYICQLTQNFCDTARIRCRIHSCEVPGQRRVTSEVRHNITLAVKEALHNAIKHAAATEITVRMEFTDPTLTITITDNGSGFDSANTTPGHGLNNMERRMNPLGGTVTFHSTPAKGTTVRFEVPIPARPSRRSSPSSSPAT